ncbi:MAG TPA: (2Fe-2S)-binding protein [Acidimicrobiales bacterium]|jgi:bacterioferritin-associated ferredoxin|nr:(2Fe-2S)-binding protein [Acidimicrobiales bacterium]
MYVCHCRAVSDRTIRAEIELGAMDEDEIGDRCGAGTRCGSCVDEIRRLCHEVRLEVRRTPVLVAG